MTADFTRRVPLRSGTAAISLPKRSQTQQSSTSLPIISFSSFSTIKNRVRPPSSSINTTKSSTTSSFISIDVSPEQSILRTPIPRRTIAFPNSPLVQEQNASPRRSHQMQLGRFLTYLRLQSLAKEKLRRQREEERKPHFVIRPTRSPFHLILESLERDIASRTMFERSSIINSRFEEYRSSSSSSSSSSPLNTPRNSLADE